MHTSSNSLQINHYKKQLSDLIITKNYNLLDDEVLELSRQLDELILPIFKQQLEFVKSIKTY